MVAVVSRFRVANGMQADVAQAFRDRPREVERAPGFLWLEVFVDSSDPTVYYLVTRWTNLESFEQWHRSPAHRESHALIPKGLKLDPAWTQVYRLARLNETTGTMLTDMVADATLLFGDYADQSPSVHLLLVGRDASIRQCNAAVRAHLEPDGGLDGRLLTDYMPAADASRLQDLLARPGRHAAPVRLNFSARNRLPFTLDCWIDVKDDAATLIGQPPYHRSQSLSDELMAINQELAVLSRERSREIRDERVHREAAEKLNRDRNAFLTVLTHELRQPIASALAAMGVLRKMNPDPALDLPRNVLERQLRQMTRLVDDLADTARVASGQVELRRADLDLTRQLNELATTWETAAQTQRKSFTSRLPDRAVMVWADPERLQQVFSNLVGNAFKYTPDGGAVTVTLDTDQSHATVTVRDEGEGIPADRLPHIFDLFQRATTTGTGLGVGLAVVQALVRAHGGEVAAQSQGLGQGSTFVVRLPLAHDGNDAAAAGGAR
jgi:signal transduction histidine kinase/heme-degrading monooxygenase HmoA